MKIIRVIIGIAVIVSVSTTLMLSKGLNEMTLQYNRLEQIQVNTVGVVIHFRDLAFKQTNEVERINALRATEYNAFIAKNSALYEKVGDLEEALDNYETEWFRVVGTVTAYSPYDDQNGINSEGDPSKTSIGLTPGDGIFAVDPRRIPYGSKIRIVYDDGTIEEGIAGDTGGDMRRDVMYHVDVFRLTYKQAMKFGKRKATIYWK